jgi:hypothetical protein
VSRPSLGQPPSPLRGFPTSTPPRTLVRVCRRANRTWWFSSDGSGRFDLDPPQGTCYFATDSFAALREATRAGPVTPDWIADRDLRRVDAPDPKARLAAVTRTKAAAFGLTTELVTSPPTTFPAPGPPRSGGPAYRGSATNSDTIPGLAPQASHCSAQAAMPNGQTGVANLSTAPPLRLRGSLSSTSRHQPR